MRLGAGEEKDVRIERKMARLKEKERRQIEKKTEGKVNSCEEKIYWWEIERFLEGKQE